MSYNDVVIGNGDLGRTAVEIFSIDGNYSISENDQSYWIARCIFGTRMTILKNTPEGKKLQNMLLGTIKVESLQKWLDLLMMQYIDPDKLKMLVAVQTRTSFEYEF